MLFLFFLLQLCAISVNGEFNCKNQYWLHPPKTSSTFCLSLYHSCCKEQFELLTSDITPEKIEENEMKKKEQREFHIETRYGCAYIVKPNTTSTSQTSNCHVNTNYHRPVPQTFDFTRSSALVILRNPSNRVISSFLDALHHEGMNESDFQELMQQMFPTKQALESYHGNNMLNNDSTALAEFIHAANMYLHHPSMLGCQTKMILGYQCADSSFVLPKEPINTALIEEAIHRLEQFYFVGIIEEYSKSVALYHKQVHQNTNPSAIELARVRSTDQRKAVILRQYFPNYSDPYDEAIYHAGQKLFQEKYNAFFSTSHELNHLRRERIKSLA